MTIASGSLQPSPSRGEVLKPRVVVQRIYERSQPSTRRRVLVDRLWPRGVTKKDADLDEWAKDVAPTHELRRWYGHDPLRFDEFSRRYRRELRRAPCADIVRRLLEFARQDGITLLTATRDVERSGARVLEQHLLANDHPRPKKAT